MSWTGITRSIAMERSMMWKVAAVGVVAGLGSGLFGIGGGVVIVPALVFIAGFPHKPATGTSLAAIVPISIAGVIGYGVSGEVDWTAAGLIAAGAVVGALIGSRALQKIDGSFLQILFAIAMVATAIKMLFDDGDGLARLDMTLVVILGLIVLGLASGILAGLLGVGGGVIIVPVLTLVFESPIVLAKGTSLAIVVPTAIVATLRNRKAGLAGFPAAKIVGAAGVLAALVASRLSLGLDPKLSNWLFAALLVFIAIRIGRTGLRNRLNQAETT